MDLSVVRHASHSTTELLVHVVWSTRHRAPVLEAAYDAWLHAFIRRKAAELECGVLAVGNASDHVHVLASYPPTVCVARLVNILKGASSHAINYRKIHAGSRFAWQAGYYAESIGRRSVRVFALYIRNQRVRHDENADPEPWEKRRS